MQYLDGAKAVVHIHPSVHPLGKTLKLQWPGWLIEYVFDTTRAAVNLIFSGAIENYSAIRFILSHAGGTLPYAALRLELAPMIETALQSIPREGIAAGLRSFWYDTALSSGTQTMGALSRVTTNDHILFGGDWPFCDQRVVAEEIALLTAPSFLAPGVVAMIKQENALKLFPQRSEQFGRTLIK
jgi:6-methylsalicylate decarboxylase